MRSNQKKVDQNNDKNTQTKTKTSTPRSKKIQQPIQSQKQSLKIGDKITSSGVVQQSQSIKSDPKIPNFQDDFSNKLERQPSGNRDRAMQDSAQNLVGDLSGNGSPKGYSIFNNSIHLIQPEFPPLFFDDGAMGTAANHNSSGSLSNSSGQASKKQRVVIKQSYSNEAKQFQAFEQPQMQGTTTQGSNVQNGDYQNRNIKGDRAMAENDQKNNNNNYNQGMNFSFQVNDEPNHNAGATTSNQNLKSTVKITPSGQQQQQQQQQQQNQYQQQSHLYNMNQQNQQQMHELQKQRERQYEDNVQGNQLKLEKKDSKKISIQREPAEHNQIKIHNCQNEDVEHYQQKINYGSNGNNNNNSNQKYNQNLLGNPVHQQNYHSTAINSLTGSHGERQKANISLTDQLVVRKSGKYEDEYINVETDNSQRDGKKLIMLGRGGFGQVFLIKQRQGNKEERAMKVILKQYQESMREVMILKKFSHPNVLKIYEYFEDDQKIYVITERCYGYNLFDYIILKGQFKEQETCKIADGVLRALAEAHKQNIVHRDVKPENIMLDFNENRESFIVKLIDWGLAEQIQDKFLTKRCGTLHYLAPEVLGKRYNEKADLWSLGMVLFTLIQGSPPICGKSQMDILEQINDFRCDFRYHCWKDISDEGKDLIQKLLDRDFNKRISATEALKHPWFSKFLSQVNINTQELRISYDSLVKYTQQNAFKKTVHGFFASHVVSKRERNKYIEIFQALDTDKNGELSIDELKAGFSKIFNEEELAFCEEKIQHIFFGSLSSIFENAQGIKYEEFLSSMLACSATYSKEQLYEAFLLFDKDKNGKITLNEIIETLGIQEQNDLINCFREIIEESDNNRDGEIDFDEFSLLMTNFLDKHSQDLLSQEIYL